MVGLPRGLDGFLFTAPLFSYAKFLFTDSLQAFLLRGDDLPPNAHFLLGSFGGRGTQQRLASFLQKLRAKGVHFLQRGDGRSTLQLIVGQRLTGLRQEQRGEK